MSGKTDCWQVELDAYESPSEQPDRINSDRTTHDGFQRPNTHIPFPFLPTFSLRFFVLSFSHTTRQLSRILNSPAMESLLFVLTIYVHKPCNGDRLRKILPMTERKNHPGRNPGVIGILSAAHREQSPVLAFPYGV